MARLHPNVLKVRKQKRQGRRAYLTSVYNLIKVPRAISISDIPEDSQALFNYRKRGSTTGLDPFLDAIFPGVKPKESVWSSVQVDKKYTALDGSPIVDTAISSHNGRKFALDLAEEEKLVALIEDPDVCDYITMRTSVMQKTRLTFVYNRQYTRCFFVEVTYAEADSFAMKSKIYGSRDRAIFDYEHKRISWMEFLELSTLSLVLPRRG